MANAIAIENACLPDPRSFARGFVRLELIDLAASLLGWPLPQSPNEREEDADWLRTRELLWRRARAE